MRCRLKAMVLLSGVIAGLMGLASGARVAAQSAPATPRAMELEVLTGLDSLLGLQTESRPFHLLRLAIDRLMDGLDPDLWTDDDHLNSAVGFLSFSNNALVAAYLKSLQGVSKSSDQQKALNKYLKEIMDAKQDLAEKAARDAEHAGFVGDFRAYIFGEIAKGDRAAAGDDPATAIQHYGEAWVAATQCLTCP